MTMSDWRTNTKCEVQINKQPVRMSGAVCNYKNRGENMLFNISSNSHNRWKKFIYNIYKSTKNILILSILLKNKNIYCSLLIWHCFWVHNVIEKVVWKSTQHKDSHSKIMSKSCWGHLASLSLCLVDAHDYSENYMCLNSNGKSIEFLEIDKLIFT